MNIGITGHQKTPPSGSWQWVRAQLVNLIKDRSGEIELAYSCLAEGADQVFAEVAVEAGLALKVVVPCEGYGGAFKSDSAKSNYEALKAKALAIDELAYAAPSEDAFMAAGEHIVNNVTLLFAVWDGQKAPGNGGTDDVVAFAVSRGVNVLHLNPVEETVTEL